MTADSPASAASPGETPDETARAILDATVAAMGGDTRDGQRAMCERSVAAMTGGDVLLAQAGTGTGKSIAYLAAAAAHAAASGERAIISTATLALQRQILLKDAPAVLEEAAKVTGARLDVALLKGWHNYVCLHKVTGGYPDDDAGALFSLDAGSSGGERSRSTLGEQVLAARAFAEDTETGDRDDMVPGVADNAWRQVSVTKLECLGPKCPVRDDCFAEAARLRAREADLVVTNHAMLGIAASGSPGVLPEFGALVVDEAHELPGRVTNAATVELAEGPIERMARSAARLGAPSDSLSSAASSLGAVLTDLPDGRLLDLPEALTGVAVIIGAAVRDLLPELRTNDEAEAGARAVITSELVVLGEIADRLTSGSVSERRDVAWVSRGTEGSMPPRLYVAPLDVAGPIADHLFAEKAVVATSATLALGGSFEPVANTLGLTLAGREWEAEDFGSPFDYARQGICYVAAHLPRPGRDGIAEEALDEIGDLVEASGGGALGLFSSRRGAQRAAEYLRARVDTPVLVQGEDHLPGLVAAFAADPAATLLGTLSLWQGVDVPGQTCRLVLIDRIPFPRPDDPLTSARTEVAAKRGANAFMEVSATHAALLLAQGAGRLIRTAADRGVVAILDPRVATAGYGRFLMGSLPGFWPTRDPQVVREALARLMP